MKTIGLLGGMSWESTQLYYRLINEETKRLRGGLHSAPIVMISVDFAEIESLQERGAWDEAARLLADDALRIEQAGADLLVLCTNTMHKLADTIQAAMTIPLLHVADATTAEIRSRGFDVVGLLGTRYTMEEAFYKKRLEDAGLHVITPEQKDRDFIHQVIFDELCLGIIRDDSRKEFLRIIDSLHTQGAQGIIEGCTEIVTLIQQNHTTIPLFDTTSIHAIAAVKQALHQ